MSARELVRAIPRGPRGHDGRPLIPFYDAYGRLIWKTVDGVQVGDPSRSLLGPEGPAGDAQIFATRSDAIAHSITSGLSHIRTGGNASVGRGGALYANTYGAVPVDAALLDIHSSDGQYFKLAGEVIHSSTICSLNGMDDHGPALRAALDRLALQGGGELVIDAGQHDIRSLRNHAIFQPASKVRISGGPRSLIKVADGVASGFMHGIYPNDMHTDRADGFQCVGFTLDMNGQNNPTSLYSVGIAIGLAIDPVISGMTLLNLPGSQGLCVGLNAGLLGLDASPTAVRPVITGNRISNVGYPVNAINVDSSHIYVVAKDYFVVGNHLSNDTQDIFGTGIELHGYGLCYGNRIRRVAKGFNIGGYPDTDASVNNNTVDECYQAATFWNYLPAGTWDGPGAGPGFYLSSAFNDNRVSVISSTKGPVLDCANAISATQYAETIKILNNRITTGEPVAVGNDPVIALGALHHLDVRGNLFSLFAGQVLALGSAPLADQKTNLHFNDNTIVGCCRTTKTNPESKYPIFLGSGLGGLGMVSIEGNHAKNAENSAMTKVAVVNATCAAKSIKNNLGIGIPSDEF